MEIEQGSGTIIPGLAVTLFHLQEEKYGKQKQVSNSLILQKKKKKIYNFILIPGKR